MTLSILEITDGTRAGTVNLLSTNLGFHLKEWNPGIPQHKGGGVFQSSSLAQGRRLVQAEFDNAQEVFTLAVNGRNQDDTIREAQKLLRLLRQVIHYWTAEEGNPVYIKAKSPCETNTRYALIHFYSIPGVDNPYAQPFFSSKIAAMDELELTIERGHWLVNPPGQAECIEVGNVQSWEYSSGNFADMGNENDCNNGVFIANMSAISNLTHIKIFDASGGSYTNIFPISSFPRQLYPATPANGDIIYFGTRTAVTNSGPFSSLVFDIATPASGTYTITWEIYTGSWVTLSVMDNTTSFSVSGVNSVHWEVPSGWVTVAIDGITGYWVRARISAFTSMVNPTQQNRQIYAANRPYVEVLEGNIQGDIPALARYRFTNQSDLSGGPLGTAPKLYSNRVICGLRSTGRGLNFDAFLNCSDEQLPDGVEVVLDAYLSFANHTLAPTGRRAAFSTSDVVSDPTSIIFNITDNAQDWYGDYHAYLRAGFVPGVLYVRLAVKAGSGGMTFHTEWVTTIQSADEFELLDLGDITVGGSLLSDEVYDVLTIEVEIKKPAGGSTNGFFYDLILIPVDEWAGDFYDFANSSTSIIGRQSSLIHLLDIDSVANPLRDIRSLVRVEDASDSVIAIYIAIVNGEAIWQENTTQRLWVLSAAYDDNSAAWIAKPQVGWSVQAYKNERYLALRGDE